MGYLIFNSEFFKIISHNLETWPERSEKYRENSWWKKKSGIVKTKRGCVRQLVFI